MKISELKIKYRLLVDRDLVNLVSKITIYPNDSIIKEIIVYLTELNVFFLPPPPVQHALLN